MGPDWGGRGFSTGGGGNKETQLSPPFLTCSVAQASLELLLHHLHLLLLLVELLQVHHLHLLLLLLLLLLRLGGGTPRPYTPGLRGTGVRG